MRQIVRLSGNQHTEQRLGAVPLYIYEEVVKRLPIFTVTSNVWGVHVRFGNFEGYALYTEPIMDKNDKPVVTRAS